MARVDWFDHDPAAPRATGRIPGASAAVRDEQGRLLLIRRADNGWWAMPGGSFELDESLVEAAVREVREESGVGVEVTGLVGIYTDPGHVAALDDGRVVQDLAVCFHARPVGGTARADGVETTDVAWVDPTASTGTRCGRTTYGASPTPCPGARPSWSSPLSAGRAPPGASAAAAGRAACPRRRRRGRASARPRGVARSATPRAAACSRCRWGRACSAR